MPSTRLSRRDLSPPLLAQVKSLAVQDMFSRMAAEGFQDVREGHGCVFGFIDLEHGSRLTDLAERAGLTKQAVGEAVAELERKGYVERVPDPEDGRAKIIKLTQRGGRRRSHGPAPVRRDRGRVG